MSGGRWFRDIYRDAVWESEDLSSDEKAVAETYARHARDAAGDKSATADISWLKYPRLMAKAGIGRRDNVKPACDSLVEKGWLVVVREVHRRSTIYRLAIPRSPDVGTSVVHAGSPDTGTSVVPEDPSRSPDTGTSVVPTPALGSPDVGTPPLTPLVKDLKAPSSSSRTPGTTEPVELALQADEEGDCFADFWKIYPKKINEKQSREAWATAVAGGATAEEIIEGAERYAKWVVAERKSAKYVSFAVNWLRDRRWTDVLERTAGAGPFINTRDQSRYTKPGGWAPYMNPTDPDAYAGYFPHSVEGEPTAEPDDGKHRTDASNPMSKANYASRAPANGSDDLAKFGGPL